MSKCTLCPRSCQIDRKTASGFCRCGDGVRIAKYYLHPFEEPILSGKNGSGTIFFCGCSLRCKFCQNFEVSRNLRGKEITVNELAAIFRELYEQGASNINLVTPTHYADKIISALKIFKPPIPVCYNTHGYEKIETIKLLNDYIDVYLPDFKYVTPARAERYSGVKDYFDFARPAIEYMIRSKPVVLGEDGLIKQGVIVHHLILPQNVDETKKVLGELKPIIGDAYLSLMSQYTPFGETDYPELKRRITRREYLTATDYAYLLGFEKIFLQEFSSQSQKFIPEWDY